jgi:polyisoprenoid-binding protein YceI
MQRYSLDKVHSSLAFSVKHMMVSTVRGKFADFNGWFEADPDNLDQVAGEVLVKTASIDTGAPDRDTHLRSGDFFESEKYPEARFVPTSVKAAGENRYRVSGDLTIRDVTRPVELTATLEGQVNDPWGNARTGVTVEGEINRTDWGLTWNQVLEAGALLVGEKIKLHIDAAVVTPIEVAA